MEDYKKVFKELMEKGVELGNGGNHHEALSCFDKALAINPRDHQAWCNKGYALQSIGKDDEAIKCYKRAVELNPKFEDAWIAKGKLFEKIENFSEAAICYGEMVEIDPNNTGMWFKKGQMLTNLGKTREAIDAFRGYIRVASSEDANSIADVQNLINILENQSKKETNGKVVSNYSEKDISILQAISHSNPEDMEIQKELMSEYLKLNMTSDFLSGFEELIKRFPDWPQFHYDLFDGLTALGNNTTLKTIFEDSIRREPNNYIFHYGYGLIQQIGCNQDMAIEEFTKVTKIMPSFTSSFLNLGIAYANKNQIDSAIEYLDHAKSKNNKMAEIHFMLGKLYQSINPMRAALHFDLFIENAYPYLAKSKYIEYAKMYVLHGKKMFESILEPVSEEKRKKEKETCPKCGKQVDKLAVLQDANKLQYFLCDECCLKAIGGRSFTVRDPNPSNKK